MGLISKEDKSIVSLWDMTIFLNYNLYSFTKLQSLRELCCYLNSYIALLNIPDLHRNIYNRSIGGSLKQVNSKNLILNYWTSFISVFKFFRYTFKYPNNIKNITPYLYNLYNLNLHFNFSKINFNKFKFRTFNRIYMQARRTQYINYKRVYIYNYNIYISSLFINKSTTNKSVKHRRGQILQLYKGKRLLNMFNILLHLDNINNYKQFNYNYLLPKLSNVGTRQYELSPLKLCNLFSKTPYKTAVYYQVSKLLDTYQQTKQLMHEDLTSNTNITTNNYNTSTTTEQVLSLDKQLEPRNIKYSTWLIPKIQFKPGFMNFIRTIRYNYVSSIGLRVYGQHTLTRYLYRFKRMSNMQMLQQTIFSLSRVLVFMKFFQTLNEATLAIHAGYIFINSRVCYHSVFQLQSGDVIQLRITYMIYAFILQQLISRESLIKTGINLILKHKNFYMKPLYVKTPALKNVSLYYDRIKLSRLLRIYNILYDVPTYYEVDYITLSCIILRNPAFIQEYDIFAIQRSAIFYHRMLNWKYIT